MTDPADRPSPVVLVHSPLLGPSTWRWVGEQLADRGHEVAVPDLRAAASTGDPQAFVTAAAAGAHEAPALLVGHSGAGWLLPCIGDAMSVRPQRLVFVDAGIPPCAGGTTVSADFLPQLRRLARRGLLPPWSQWWDRDMLAELLPDPAPAERSSASSRRSRSRSSRSRSPSPAGGADNPAPTCGSATATALKPREPGASAGRLPSAPAATSTSSAKPVR